MSEFERLLRRIVLGVSAAPLVLLPGCGRSELVLEPDASVIPSRDAGMMIVDAGRPDAGVFDAGLPDAGSPDAGLAITFAECPPHTQVTTWLGRVPVTYDPSRFLSPEQCAQLCDDGFNGGFPFKECTPVGTTELVCWGEFCAIGRLAEGVNVRADASASRLGRHFAQMAALEATAVVAFEQLASELNQHALPRGLQRAASRAAGEERRHAAIVSRLARRLGGRSFIERNASPRTRSLEELAFDNAVEGCARETFGAMVGLYQSLHAPDPEVRRVFASVSRDELGHGRWSWALADALETRLPLASKRRARGLRDEALAQLTRGVLEGHSPEERLALGLPDQERLESMASALRSQLFTRSARS